MVTKEQAMRCHEFHFGTCTRHIGPQGGVTEHVQRWRSNGQCKTWVTRPGEFSLPIKYGLYGCSYLHHGNADLFHVAEECPLVLDEAQRKEQ
jgi:hypothetical protein